MNNTKPVPPAVAAYLSAIGRTGGKQVSAVKAAASRANGAKGGRKKAIANPPGPDHVGGST